MEEDRIGLMEQTKLNEDIFRIIEGSKQRLATTVNAEICMLHWNIGNRIKEDVLFNQRAEYGKQILRNLSEVLIQKFGKGWGFL